MRRPTNCFLPIDQINSPIAAVAVPALSRLKDSPERYRLAYTRMLEKVAILTMPGMALLIATSDWVVRLVLGPQWSDAAHIFALLGIFGLVQPLANTTGWLFISQGRTHHMFQWGLIGCSIIIVSICVGLPWGATGVALSYSVAGFCIVTPTLFWFVGRVGPVRTKDLYYTMAPPACAAAGVLLALFVFRQWALVTNPLKGLAIASVIAFGVTLLVLIAIPAGRRALQDVGRSIAALSRKGQVGSLT